jgi:2,4-dienoyl-CoA reductase-like NADH-dependent reductase (Old Yellow Enzyme family)
MSSHYVSIKRGVEGTASADFTTGTASAATDLFEFRILDGVTPTTVEVNKAIEAIERFFQSAKNISDAGFDVAG